MRRIVVMKHSIRRPFISPDPRMEKDEHKRTDTLFQSQGTQANNELGEPQGPATVQCRRARRSVTSPVAPRPSSDPGTMRYGISNRQRREAASSKRMKSANYPTEDHIPVFDAPLIRLDGVLLMRLREICMKPAMQGAEDEKSRKRTDWRMRGRETSCTHDVARRCTMRAIPAVSAAARPDLEIGRLL